MELDSRKSDGATELRDREKQLGVVTEEMKRKSTRVGVLEGRCRILEDEIGDLQKAEHIREEEHGKKLISQQQEQKGRHTLSILLFEALNFDWGMYCVSSTCRFIKKC